MFLDHSTLAAACGCAAFFGAALPEMARAGRGLEPTTRMWHNMWNHSVILCDITYDVTLWCHMWCHIWYGKMNVISHMMCLFVAYDFTCDITVFLLWYHIIVISHCDVIMWYHMWYAVTSHDIHIWHHIWYHSSNCDIIVRLWYHIIMISQSENHDITYDIIVWCRLGIHMIS